MTVENLASNLILLGSDTFKVESSRPVSMTGANKVAVTVNVTRVKDLTSAQLSVLVQFANDPEKKWTTVHTVCSVDAANIYTGNVAVPLGWVRLLYNYSNLHSTAEIVFDADINTQQG